MQRTRQPLDSYDDIPAAMKSYFRNYGRHFNNAMYDFAVSQMRKSDGSKLQPLTKERYDTILKQANIKLEYDMMCDGMYVMSMALSDFMGSSIMNEQQLAKFVKDYVDDADQVDGFIFNRFYADCVLKGIPIEWEDML